MPRTDVVIVGGGASGLAAGGALAQRGIQAVILDRDDEIGGRGPAGTSGSTCTRFGRFSGLPGLEIPRDHGRYVSKDHYAEYLSEYARRFGLDVRMGQEATCIRPAWTVESGGATWQSRVVVVATGKYARKRLPQWPGLDQFGGPVVHSVDYRTGRDFAAMRVLVVGAGNSGSEIAADLSEQGAAHVAIAIRTPPPISSREVLGVPVQLWGIALDESRRGSSSPSRHACGSSRRAISRSTGSARPAGLR